jgi:hypothetical protein
LKELAVSKFRVRSHRTHTAPHPRGWHSSQSPP